MFEKVFKSINDFFDPKYVDTSPIPKQEDHPDELMQKVKKTILESGMFEHAKNFGYGKIEVDIEGFIADFKRLMIFIATINYLVANTLFKAEHDGQNVFQVNYKYAKTNGMRKFWIWQKKERETNRYLKYFI